MIDLNNKSNPEFKNQLVELLSENVLNVTFIKVNGEERVMECTLMPEVIENYKAKNEGIVTEKPKNPSTMTVWDMVVNNWRCFRLESVTSVSLNK